MTLEGQGRADCWGNTWSGSGIVFLQLADDMLTLNASYDAFGAWIANDLLNSSRLEFYMPYLIKVGYQSQN